MGPYFLGDKGNYGVEHDQGFPQNLQKAGSCIVRRLAPALQLRLYHLQIPVAELVPHELIQFMGRVVETVFIQGGGHVFLDLFQTVQDPAVGKPIGLGRGKLRDLFIQVHEREPGRVPDLVYKMAIPLDALLGHLYVPAHGRESGQGKAEGVRAEILDGQKGIDHVALGLAHLLTLGVPDQGVDIHVPKRHLGQEVNAHHHHPGHPEKKYIKTGDQNRGGIKSLQVLGLIRPAQGGKRPQGGGEPGIQDILVLA